jgi:ligand-binding SRPBCC domain-containing protein
MLYIELMQANYQVSHKITVNVSQEVAFAFHADVNNIEKVLPSFLSIKVQKLVWPVGVGSEAVLQFRLFNLVPLFSWKLQFTQWNPLNEFIDRELGGFFKVFLHLHKFTQADAFCELTDTITYQSCALPFLRPLIDGFIFKLVLKTFLISKLQSTKRYLESHAFQPWLMRLKLFS